MLLSDFPVLFKAYLIFKDFSRKPSFQACANPDLDHSPARSRYTTFCKTVDPDQHQKPSDQDPNYFLLWLNIHTLLNILLYNFQSIDYLLFHILFKIPGHVAQSVTCLATDACLTATPGVASVIPARSHTFVEIDHEIISTVILLPSADSFKKGCCQLQAKVCARITGYLPRKKVWLGELTVPQWP